MALARQYVEQDRYTEVQYLAWEETAVEKSEYIDGKIRAMSGGSEFHALIPTNISAELRMALRGRGCRYQQIETQRSYLLVSQTEPRVELFERGENGHWDYSLVAGLENSVTIPSLNVTLALSEVYDQVDFADAAEE